MSQTVKKTLSHIQLSKSFYKAGRCKEATKEAASLLNSYVGHVRRGDVKSTVAAFETIRGAAIADRVNPPTIAVLSNYFLPTKAIRETKIWQSYVRATALDMPDNFYNQRVAEAKSWLSLVSVAHAARGQCLEGTSLVDWKSGPTVDQYNHIVDRFNKFGAGGKDDGGGKKEDKSWWETAIDWLRIEANRACY
jgi:hypothetical protein